MEKKKYRLIDLRHRLEADKKEKDGILAQIKNEPNCANHEQLERRLKGLNSEIEDLTKRIHKHEGKDENAWICETIYTSLLGEYRRDYCEGKTIVGCLNEDRQS